jgi:predicted amidohydrolase YtcJ
MPELRLAMQQQRLGFAHSRSYFHFLPDLPMKHLLLSLFACANVMAICQSTSDTQIFFNGTIFTGTPTSYTVEAVAIRQDKILALGSLASVQKAAGNTARMTDLKGAYMMPGLIDSHNHAISGGRSLLVANLGDTLLTPDAIVQYARKSIANRRGLRGDVLYIQGMHSATWNDFASLQRSFDAPEFAERGVFLRGSDGHTAWANAALLKRAGINSAFINKLPATEQHYFGLYNGVPNGLLSEHAIQYVSDVVPPSSIGSLEALVAATKHLNSLGITAWMDPAAGSTEDGTKNQSLDTYEQAVRANKLTAHVSTIIVANGNEDPKPQIDVAKKWQSRLASTPIMVAGFKIFSDGVMEYPTQTASMLVPYKNSGQQGSQMVDPQKFKDFVIAADREKLLVHVHAIGDKAVTETLDAIAAARHTNKNKNIPHSITHLQCVQPSDLTRFKDLNVLASMQLLWATADSYTEELVKPYIHETAYTYMYPARSIMESGGTICGASDWPVSSANPFEAIYVAETRKGANGILNGRESMTRKDMLQAYTLHAARAILREKEIGSLDAGKQADLIVLDRNLLTVPTDSVRNAKVLWTMHNGKIIYQR